jgi:ribosomal protein S18 acetylase RimI-like enzyme
MQVRIGEADLDAAGQVAALVEIIDSYARGAGGANAPLGAEARANLAKGLREQAAALVLLAWRGEEIVGTAVCYWGFSTFAGRPSLNVHDLAVLPGFQGQGIGRGLLREAERRARERGCCKITLEVHETNEGARRLYEREGFGPWRPATLFVSKPLED